MTDYTVSVGHQVAYSLEFLDQSGNPMLVTPTPDSPPTWSNAPNPAGDATLTPAAPGNLTAIEAAVAAGTDVVSVSLSVGGVSFAATSNVNISPAPQVLTSVNLVGVVS